MSDAILKQRDADETKNGICEFDSVDADALAKCIEDSYEYIKNNTNHPGVPDWVVMTATTTSKIVGDAVKKLQSTAYSGQLFGLNNSSSLLDVGDAWKASALESMPINKISSFLSGSFAGVLVGVATSVYTNQDNQQKMIDDLEKVVPSVLIGYGLTELLVAGAGCVVLAPEAAVAIGVILAAYTTNFIIKTVTESDWFNDLFGEADKVIDNELRDLLNLISGWFAPRDPLILDLDGDGVETTNVANNQVLFDFDGDGRKTGYGWVGKDDGLLVIDHNQNGQIDDASELFSEMTWNNQGAVDDGFAALRVLDSNKDGVFNAQDEQFAKLQIWQDANQNGITDAGELTSLAERGITSIDLNVTYRRESNNGNTLTSHASYQTADGQLHDVAAALFSENAFNRDFTTDIEIPKELAGLPDMAGTGYLRDLKQAAVLNPQLAEILKSFSAPDMTREQQLALMDDMLFEWSKTNEDASSSILSFYRHGFTTLGYNRWVNDQAGVSEYIKRIDSWSPGQTGGATSEVTETPESIYKEGMAAIDSVKKEVPFKEWVDKVMPGLLLEAKNNPDSRYVDLLNFYQNDEIRKAAVLSSMAGFSLGFSSDRVVVRPPIILGNTAWSTPYTPPADYAEWLKLDEGDEANPSFIFDLSFRGQDTPQAVEILLNQAYSQAISSSSEQLLKQVRISTYFNDINVSLNADGHLSLDFTAVNQRLETLAATNPADAIADLSDIIQTVDTGSLNWDADSFLRSIVNMVLSSGMSRETLCEQVAAASLFSKTGTVNNDSISLPSGQILFESQSGDDVITGNGRNNIIWGSSGNDVLLGGDGNDLLDGGIDNDTLEGDNGNDSLDGGDGDDTINAGNGNDQVFGGLGADRIDGGAGNDVIDGGDCADTITDTVGANIIKGGQGNDTITGRGSMEGGEGDDTITAGDFWSADTYIFNLGDGKDIINDYGGSTAMGYGAGLDDTLKFGAGIEASAVTLERSGNDLIFKVSATDQVSVKGWYVQGLQYIEKVQFADGTTWDIAKLMTMMPGTYSGTAAADSINGWDGVDNISGLAGNDTLNGYGGNDSLDGGDGDDTINAGNGNDQVFGGLGADRIDGGAGNDTYWFGLGDGQDLISDYDSLSGNQDVMQLDGIACELLWFSKNGNNLDIAVIGSSDKVSIQNWYSGQAYHVEQFKTADGKTLLDSQVQALVSAMASLTPPAVGQTTLPDSYQSTLSPVLAANWK